ncbi:mycothiol transferase [Amycolatopsis pithecellobii]|uniref:DUF664 domain-containing protein n=1 Tax=Amycolatopsis pithecellobii TaxID=664692 RepID=A0A6N7YSW8_9PSEU|nr:DUF664 domain-containing protein [Amycolatopsis pithecellobii]MTD56125.1 DUF664 domain-containing protein [Amycolatopsis pithecellobii]
MTWTAPEIRYVDDPIGVDERTLLTGFLAWHRTVVPAKCAGLTGEAAEDYERLLEESRIADRIFAAASLDDAFTHDGQTFCVRLLYLHLIQEYARHNGHADLMRERIDGKTGE